MSQINLNRSQDEERSQNETRSRTQKQPGEKKSRTKKQRERFVSTIVEQNPWTPLNRGFLLNQTNKIPSHLHRGGPAHSKKTLPHQEKRSTHINRHSSNGGKMCLRRSSRRGHTWSDNRNSDSDRRNITTIQNSIFGPKIQVLPAYLQPSKKKKKRL